MDATAIERLWEGGPLREFSTTRVKSSMIVYKDGYAGCYVCDECLQPVLGVYSVPAEDGIRWRCGTCREELRERGAQPEALRRHQAVATGL